MTRTWPIAVLAALVIASSCSSRGEREDVAPGAPLLAEGEAIDLFKVSEAVWAREAKHGFSALSEPEQTFLCVWSLEAEVNNGGFSQFFENSAGDHAAATPAALRQVGASQMADLVERAMEPFGAAGPPADRAQRSRAMESLPPSAGELWGKLDGEFYDLPSPEPGLRALVEANRGAFLAP